MLPSTHGLGEAPVSLADSTPSLAGRRQPISILHLEDNPADREFARRAMHVAKFPATVTYAADREAFERSVRNGGIDLIISDYTLPGYSGGEALKFAREVAPDCPFVFLSGTIGEERAVESLRCGAADFVLKDKIGRLVPTLQRVIDEAENRIRCEEAEEKLRESEARFQAMAAMIPDIFWVASSRTGDFEYVSPAFQRVFRSDPAPPSAALWMESIIPEDRPRVPEPWKPPPSSREHRMSYRIRQKDGSIRWLEERRFPERGTDRIIGITSDVTERRELEAELSQAQKMEAIGQMAGKTAHDFNNFIIVICGHAQMLLRRKDLPASARASLKEIELAGERSAKLTRELLMFSRNQRVQLVPCDLNEIVAGSLAMLRDLAGSGCEVVYAVNCTRPRLFADRTMVEQVLMNLVVNARDAMPQGGKITIGCDLVTMLDGSDECQPGKYVRLSVRDTGTGIPPEVLPRIFEPFYTTKQFGKGTGLGLASVFGIVNQHHGRIDVESKEGQGTVFQIYLPADKNAA